MTRKKKLASLGAMALTLTVIPVSVAASCKTEGDRWVEMGVWGVSQKYNVHVATAEVGTGETISWKQMTEDPAGPNARNYLSMYFHEGVARNILGSIASFKRALADGVDYIVVSVHKVTGASASTGMAHGGTQGELIKKYDKVGKGGISIADFTKEVFKYSIDELWNSIDALPSSVDKPALKTWFKAQMTSYKANLAAYETNYPAGTGAESVNAGTVTDALEYAIAKT